jgi:drug/metabolite transporter (DMT)-like permease
VVLLFYLMPLWTVLLARLLLGERLTPAAMLRTVLALVGAAIVLWPTRATRAPTGRIGSRCRARFPTGSASSAGSRSRSTT